MTVQEIYNSIKGNYSQVINRMITDERIEKYLGMFLKDDNMLSAGECIADGRYEEAFRRIHNLKGVCLNLSFDWLAESVVILCEELRGCRYTDNIEAYYEAALERYNYVTEILRDRYGQNGVK